MTILDFSFADHAAEFDAHITASIPGYEDLCWWCSALSRSFVQNGTRVVDVGCTTGRLLHHIREANQPSRPSVAYLGLDIEPNFEQHWRRRREKNLRFQVDDALSFDGFKDMSLALSVFTLQFIPERFKMNLLRRVYDGLAEGGALFIAEKTFAANPAIQGLMASTYYDYKRKSFSPDQILDKDQSLRGQMNLWTKQRLMDALRAVGFLSEDIECFWAGGPFVGYMAVKRAPLHSCNTAEWLMAA
jgi:tRNA (cmo5U34)-methyltransferase